VPTTAQITPFGRGTSGHDGDQFAAQLSGYGRGRCFRLQSRYVTVSGQRSL
jgi:hypothetical protein